MSVPTKSNTQVLVSGVVLVVGAGVGLTVGLVVTAVGKKRGRPTLGRQLFQVAQHGIQGLALGTFAAEYIGRLLDT